MFSSLASFLGTGGLAFLALIPAPSVSFSGVTLYRVFLVAVVGGIGLGLLVGSILLPALCRVCLAFVRASAIAFPGVAFYGVFLVTVVCGVWLLPASAAALGVCNAGNPQENGS